GLVTCLGGGGISSPARRHCACGCAGGPQEGHGEFFIERHDIQRQALWPALLRGYDFLHLQQEGAEGRWDRGASNLGRGHGGGGEAEGQMHGTSDRLRIQSGAAELLRCFRVSGLWPRW